MSSSAQARIENKLRCRYLRDLALRRPDTWQYSEPWRTFARAIRRQRNHFWSAVTRSQLVNRIAVVLSGCVGLGIVVVVAGALALGLVILAEMVLLDMPARIGQVGANELARIAFTRLAILQSLAWIGTSLVGLRFDIEASHKPQRRFVKRRLKVREHIRMLLVLSLANSGFFLIGSAICAGAVPFFWPSFIAGAVVSLSLGWSGYWVARWLGKLCLPSRHGLVVASLFLAAVPIVMATIGFFWNRPVLPLSQHLAALGPVGWLHEQTLQIGNGRNFPWLSLSVAMATLWLVTQRVRRRVHSWQHRRRILALAIRREEIKSPPPVAGHLSQVNLQQVLREEIRRIPAGWQSWIWPRWLARYQWLLFIIAASCLAMQGVAVFLHSLVTSLAEIPTVGDLPTGPHHIVQSVVLISLITMVFSVEGFGLMRDLPSLSRFAVRPISPWGLWKQTQWFGLLRLPRILILAAPFLVIPLVMMEEIRLLALLSLGLCVSSLFAVRTFMVAGFVNQATCTFLPSWIGVTADRCLGLLTMLLLLLSLPASLPLEGTVTSAIIFQTILQVATVGLFGLATALWHVATR